MTVSVQTAAAPSRKQLALLSGGALVAASIITACFVLPAEFGIDPTGFGKLSGLDRLGAPLPRPISASAEAVAAGPIAATRDYARAYRTDSIEIPLAAGGDAERRDEIEYKVRMKAGDSFVYSWSVEGVPSDDEFYYDFHGETPAGPGGTPAARVVEYKQATGRAGNGTLVAPIAGVHGWYLQNQSARAVVVRVRLSGFYDLVPPGEYGNSGGIVANRPVAR